MSDAALARDVAPAAPASLLDELNGAIASGDAKRRLRIMLRIADLFTAGSRNYSGDQIAVFDDVLQELATDIEVEARAELARRLAGIDSAPPQIVRSLAFDDAIEVAGPVLAKSEQLSDDDLVENAGTKSQAHLFAISQRLKLSEAVTDVLVERGDRRVVNKVARNRGARFSLAGYEKLTVRARRDSRLTLALGRRGVGKDEGRGKEDRGFQRPFGQHRVVTVPHHQRRGLELASADRLGLGLARRGRLDRGQLGFSRMGPVGHRDLLKA